MADAENSDGAETEVLTNKVVWSESGWAKGKGFSLSMQIQQQQQQQAQATEESQSSDLRSGGSPIVNLLNSSGSGRASPIVNFRGSNIHGSRLAYGHEVSRGTLQQQMNHGLFARTPSTSILADVAKFQTSDTLNGNGNGNGNSNSNGNDNCALDDITSMPVQIAVSASDANAVLRMCMAAGVKIKGLNVGHQTTSTVANSVPTTPNQNLCCRLPSSELSPLMTSLSGGLPPNSPASPQPSAAVVPVQRLGNMATAPLRQVGLLEQFLFKISGLQKGAMLHMQSGDNYFHQKGIMESKGTMLQRFISKCSSSSSSSSSSR